MTKPERRHNIAPYAAQGGAASRRNRLTLTRVEEAFDGPITSIADAQRRLDVISCWSMAGLRHGAQCSAAVQACREWISAQKARESIDSLKTMVEQQQQRIRELTAELVRAKRRTV